MADGILTLTLTLTLSLSLSLSRSLILAGMRRSRWREAIIAAASDPVSPAAKLVPCVLQLEARSTP